jgi:unsaturated rhamnogalacturonyl hydrolase
MIRRGFLSGALAAGAVAAIPRGSRAATAELSPAQIGALAAADYLGRQDFMRYDVGDVHAVHYADVATAYGALRLAAATRDTALRAGVAARHARLVAAALPNTANHVDANVYGVWPLELARQTGDWHARTLGLAMADGQWRATTPDGLTTQARYWIDDVWMIGALQLQAWRATREHRYLDRAALMARLYLARLQEPGGAVPPRRQRTLFLGARQWLGRGRPGRDPVRATPAASRPCRYRSRVSAHDGRAACPSG